jgi:hypothetical protein
LPTPNIRFVESIPSAPGDSSEQREAETVMMAEFSRIRGVALKPTRIALDGGVIVQVDGVADDYSLLCEAFAHQGPLKGGQVRKVIFDSFKLTFLARRWPQAEMVLLFSDEEATRLFRLNSRSWLAQAVQAAGLKVEVVEIPSALRVRVQQAQKRQSR